MLVREEEGKVGKSKLGSCGPSVNLVDPRECPQALELEQLRPSERMGKTSALKRDVFFRSAKEEGQLVQRSRLPPSLTPASRLSRSLRIQGKLVSQALSELRLTLPVRSSYTSTSSSTSLPTSTASSTFAPPLGAGPRS